MKVAIVYPIPFGEHGRYGGGERYAWQLALALAERVETVFITTGPRRRRYAVGALQVEKYGWWTLLHGVRANPLTLGFLAAVRGADVIHCLTYSTLMTDLSVLAARGLGKRVFLTDIGGGGDVTLSRWLNIAGMANGLLALSAFSSESFASRTQRRRVIWGGVDTSRFLPDPAAKRAGVLYVGRLVPHKGIHYLVDAVDPAVPVTIMGRPYAPAYFAHLQEQARGKRVTFVTDATDDMIVRAYQSCAVFVGPSVYDDGLGGGRTELPELLGLTLLEAMACGAPLVCTQVGSYPELVRDGVHGYVVPPNDAAAIRRGVDALLSDPERARQTGEAGREHVLQNFTWGRVAERCLEAYLGREAGLVDPPEAARTVL